MAVNLSPIWGAGAQLLDNSGNVLSGGKIYTYAAGTTTPVATYTSSSGITANSNPIILNSAGRVPYEIWLTDGISYKFVLKDSNDTLIGTYDNLVGINSNFIAYTAQQEIQTATAGQTVFNLTTMQYQPATNNLSVFVDGVNQYGPGAQYAYVETDSDTVTFVSGLHDGASVKFTTASPVSSSSTDAQNVSYTPPFTAAVGTNVEAKLSEYVSVKDFGAVGDGVTDDTVAIQAALDSGANLITFPVGDYYVAGQVTVSSNTIIDFGASQITTDYNGVLFYVAGTSGSRKENVVFRNGTLTATTIGTTGQMAIQAIWADNVSVQNCIFNDFGGVMVKFNGGNYNCEVVDSVSNNSGLIAFYAEADGSASPVEQCDNIRFVRNTVVGGDYGIEAKQSTNVLISENFINGTGHTTRKPGILVTRDYSTGAEYPPRGIIVTDNIIENCDGYGIQITESADVIVSNNRVYNTYNTGISVAGSHLTVSNNQVSKVTGTGSGFAFGYADVTTGSHGITDNGYSNAHGTFIGNSANLVSNISMNFVDITDCTITNNEVSFQNYAGYAMQFATGAYVNISNNRVYSGTYTFGYRLNTSITNSVFSNNQAVGFTNGESSIPANHPGYFLQSFNDVEEFVPFVQTTNATPTTLYTRDIDTNTLYGVEATVVCRSGSYRAFYKLMGCVYRASGSATVQGSVTVVASAESDAGLDATITASGNAIIVQVTGIAASNIDWSGRVQLTKVV